MVGVLIALYSIRSKSQSREQPAHPALPHQRFLLQEQGAAANARRTLTSLFAAVVEQTRLKRYASGNHITVDGTPLECWASLQRFRPRDRGSESGRGGGRSPDVHFRGRNRSNTKHCSF